MPDAQFRVSNAMARRLAVSQDIRNIAALVLLDAQARTPRVTGTLAGGWTLTAGRDPGTWLVRNSVPYARFVEYGTRHRPAAAMLGRAVASARPRWER